MPDMDNPFEPRNLTARQIRIGNAWDEATREVNRARDEGLEPDKTLLAAVGLVPDRALTPEQLERMWAHREKLYLEDALALHPEEMEAVKARLEAKERSAL